MGTLGICAHRLLLRDVKDNRRPKVRRLHHQKFRARSILMKESKADDILLSALHINIALDDQPSLNKRSALLTDLPKLPKGPRLETEMAERRRGRVWSQESRVKRQVDCYQDRTVSGVFGSVASHDHPTLLQAPLSSLTWTVRR